MEQKHGVVISVDNRSNTKNSNKKKEVKYGQIAYIFCYDVT